MADFSRSGVADLPVLTADSIRLGDPQVLGWLQEWREEGEAINRADPSYDLIGKAQEYIVGEQLPEECRLPYLPQVTINETRKAMQAHVSALTDLKPLAGWKAAPEYRRQADLLNQYLFFEWISYFLDLELGDTVKYSLAGGTGDMSVEWNPHLVGGGGHEFVARDARDTLPLRPGRNSRSIQQWEGVMLREEHTVNSLRGMYPQHAQYIKSADDNALASILGRFRHRLSGLLSPMNPLDSINVPASMARKRRSGGVALYRAYFKDRSRNLTDKGIPMGRPGTNDAYVVPPQGAMYPRGRLIVATENIVLYDGPNVYWHGLFPIARLRLWSVPWQILGVPLFNDLLPVQDAINDTANDLRLGIRQWMNPDVTWNRNSVSEATMRLLDPRKPGKKLKVNTTFGEPYKKEDGPNPQVLALALELWRELTQKFADLSGTANLAALMQLRQLPSADTIQKYYEALTPEIRSEARQIEAFLRETSEMVKGNYFQYLDKFKRVQVLGIAGEALSDFDFDPNTLVPTTKIGVQGEIEYRKELDPDLTTRDQRAMWFQQQFVFMVAPNSILAMNSTETKMLRLQLARMGYLDFWSLHETLETPNVGTPPALPLPPLEPPPPGVMQMLLQQAQAALPLMMATAGGAQAGGAMGLPPYTDPGTGKTFVLDPASMSLLEIRIPTTITERLQAQALLGIGMTASPAGRKSSGQESPQVEEKSDGAGGSRQTVTESDK